MKSVVLLFMVLWCQGTVYKLMWNSFTRLDSDRHCLVDRHEATSVWTIWTASPLTPPCECLGSHQDARTGCVGQQKCPSPSSPTWDQPGGTAPGRGSGVNRGTTGPCGSDGGKHNGPWSGTVSKAQVVRMQILNIVGHETGSLIHTWL